MERERVKLRAKLDLNLVPEVILRQLSAYESVRVKKVIRFRASSRPESVRLRNAYIQDNLHNIFVPRKETKSDYIRTLNEPYRSTYGYRSVYPANDQRTAWYAELTILALPLFPAISPDNREHFQNSIPFIKKECAESGLPIVKAFRIAFSKGSRNYFQNLQWNEFTSTSLRNPLTRFRDAWYHDPLLHQIQNPYMRIIRKCRLGVSELRAHSWFFDPSKSRKCNHCHTQHDETLEHFFLKCPAFATQRTHFLKRIVPILKTLSLPITVASFLGFDKNLVCKRYSKRHGPVRRRIYRATCDFLKHTKRFTYV